MFARKVHTSFIAKMSREIAIDAHAGQKYGGKDYFEYHILGVVEVLKTLMPKNVLPENFGGTPVGDKTEDDYVEYHYYTSTAILHDTLEDSEWTVDMLLDNLIPDEVVDAVVLLTKTEDTVIEDYLTAIKGNKYALAAKVADMTFNMNNCIAEGNLKRFSKYAEQMKILLG